MGNIIDKVASSSTKVSCQGKEAPYDHPLVYLVIEDKEVFCPYCSRKFVLKTQDK